MSERCRIAVIEDEADIRTIIELSLNLDPNIEVTTFSSGESFLAHLHETPDSFDAAIIDLRMMGMNGLQLLEKLQQSEPHLGRRSIFLTASLMPREQEAMEALSALGIIEKPFNPLSLAELVKSFLASQGGGCGSS